MSSSTPSAPTTAPRDQMIRLGTTSMRVTTISVNWRSSPAAVCLGLKVLAKWPRPLPKLARNCAAATQFPTSLQISLRMATIAESRLKRTNWERSSKFARAKDISRGPYPRSVPTPRPWPAAQFWPRDSAGQKFWEPTCLHISFRPTLSCLPRSPTTTVCGGVGSYNFVLRGRDGNSSRCACRVWHLGLLDHPGWRPCNDAAWGNIASHHTVGPNNTTFSNRNSLQNQRPESDPGSSADPDRLHILKIWSTACDPFLHQGWVAVIIRDLAVTRY